MSKSVHFTIKQPSPIHFSYGKGTPVINPVDQEFNPESKNAQSGTAVAEAISTKADKATTLKGYGITDGLTANDIDQEFNPESKNAQSGTAVAEALKTVKIDVDQEYNPESENAISGKGVKEAIADEINVIAPLKFEVDKNNKAPYANELGIAIGIGADASCFYENLEPGEESYLEAPSIAIGNNAKATSQNLGNNIAIGNDAEATGYYSMAIGPNTEATGTDSIAIGTNSIASRDNVVSFGREGSEDGSISGITRRIVYITDPVNAQDAATKNYVDTSITSAIESIVGVKFSIVTALPDIGENGTIYLVKHDDESDIQNIYDEYIWLETDSKFEKIGTTEVDLTGYVKSTDVATESTNGVMSAEDKAKLDKLGTGSLTVDDNGIVSFG